jgi:hypothetical protein
VDAVTEGEVRVGGTPRVKLRRMLEVRWVTVGLEQCRNHGVAGCDGHAAELDLLRRVAGLCDLRRALEAQDLLDELGNPRGLGTGSALGGCSSSVRTPVPMRLTVVSWPATSSRPAIEVNSSSLSLSSPSRIAVRADSRSSPGEIRLMASKVRPCRHLGRIRPARQARQRADPSTRGYPRRQRSLVVESVIRRR